MNPHKPKYFPSVTQEAYNAVTQSLLEDGGSDFTGNVLHRIQFKNPILAKYITEAINDALDYKDKDPKEFASRIVNTLCVMYVLLRNQSEADEMNKEMV